MATDETEPADDDIDWGDVGMEMPQAAPIDRIRRAVAVLRHPAASEDPLASATQALEGVVEGTEAATEAILSQVLQQVDAHLEELLEIVGHDQVAALPPPAEREGDARLLNGPVDDASRVSQSDIDSLFD